MAIKTIKTIKAPLHKTLNEVKKSSKQQPHISGSMIDEVEERLRKFFIQKGFKTGDAIPKEQELADSLQVSRNMVREALSRLRMLGMIDSRKRRGMVLTEPDIMSGLERIFHSKSLLGEDALKELFELRLTIEIGMADLIFFRKTDALIDKLAKIVTDEDNSAHTVKDNVKYDIAFHGTLYEMSGNDTLSRFQKMLIYVFEYALKVTTKLEPQKRSGVMKHNDLLRILKHGTVEEFRTAMRLHLEPYFLLLN